MVVSVAQIPNLPLAIALNGTEQLEIVQAGASARVMLSTMQSYFATVGGTVTSVGLSGGSTGFTVSGSPVTSSGTMTLSGTLNVDHGGTGVATLTQYGIPYGNGTSPIGVTGAGTNGQVLMAHTGLAPTWETPGFGGSVTSVSVVSANGFAGTVLDPATTPAITLSTTVTGLLLGNGTAVSAAPTTGSGNVVLAVGPTIGLVNGTGLPLTTGVTGILPGANGGTGVNNSTRTITIGGNFAMSGAFTFTGTLTGNTGVTFPTSGTLATTTSPSSSIVVGTTTVTSGVSGRVLYDNAGTLGEMTNTGTGTVNVLQTSPALITPALGVATATSLAVAGVTLGVSTLATTGTSAAPSLVAASGIFKMSTSSTQELAIGGYTSGAFGVWFQGRKITNDGTTWPLILQPLGGRVGIGNDTPLALLDVAGAVIVSSSSAAALSIGLTGATNPAFQVDASVGSQAAGLKITGAVAAGTVALAVISSGAAANLSIDAKGSGTITIGGTSTGAITLTRATTMNAALTYGGVALANSVTGTGSMVLSIGPTFTGTAAVANLTIGGTLVQTSNSATAFVSGPNGATNPVFTLVNSTASQAAGLRLTGAVAAGTVTLDVISSGANANLSIDAKGSGTITIGGTSTGAITLTRATTMNAALTYGGVTLANAVTGTGAMVLANAPAFTGTATGPGTLTNLVVRTQVFSVSGTYTPHASMVYCHMGTWAAGGGGGSVASSAGLAFYASGGGGGAYSSAWASKSVIGASQTVTIGAGGTGATAGANTGGNGGDTSVGALCVAKGGSGGPGLTSTTPYNAGGAGGLASGGTGNVKLNGHNGSGGMTINYITGGSGIFAGYGGGSPGLSGPTYSPAHTAANVVGNAGAANSGAGGSSAWCINSSDAAGGAGGTGYVVITEYCTA